MGLGPDPGTVKILGSDKLSPDPQLTLLGPHICSGKSGEKP
jgi:hypothetical protein